VPSILHSRGGLRIKERHRNGRAPVLITSIIVIQHSPVCERAKSLSADERDRQQTYHFCSNPLGIAFYRMKSNV